MATRLRADARRNRDQILVAARFAFVEQGVDVPMDELARRAGVGVGTLYRRFPDRVALLRQSALDAMRNAITELTSARDTEPDAWSALGTFLRRMVDLRFGGVLPVVLPALREQGADDPEYEASARQLQAELGQAVDDLVAAAQAEGALRAGVTSADVLLAAALLSRPFPGTDETLSGQLALRQLQLFLDGVGAGPRAAITGPALSYAELLADFLGGPGRPSDHVSMGLDGPSVNAQ